MEGEKERSERYEVSLVDGLYFASVRCLLRVTKVDKV